MSVKYYDLDDQSLSSVIEEKIDSVQNEGYQVEFGTIGKRTTYCILCKGDVEIVGYTYIKGDLAKRRVLIGKYKALMQAVNRKYLLYDSVEYEVEDNTYGC